jgi:hypothetical protein
MRAECPPVSERLYTARVYSRAQPGRTCCVKNSGNGRAAPLDVGGILRGERSTHENISGRHTRRVSSARCKRVGQREDPVAADALIRIAAGHGERQLRGRVSVGFLHRSG